MDPQRIIVINPFGIGDVLFTTPLVRAIKRAFPQSRIGYLCNRRTETILENNPHIEELFVYEKDEFTSLWKSSKADGLRYITRLLGRLKAWRFDLAIDLSLGERYGLIMKGMGVRRRVGFNYRSRGRFLSDKFDIDGYHSIHVVAYYKRLLRFIGIDMPDCSSELFLDAQTRDWAAAWFHEHGIGSGELRIGIVPAGGVSWGIDAPFRRWGSAGFAEVGDALAEKFGARILTFGEKRDRPICKEVAGLMRNPVIDLSGETNLAQFVGLLANLDLVICNDGGPLHLAVSQRVKTVSVFGPVDHRVYGPYPLDPDRHQVVYRDDLMCRPCYHRFRLPPCPYERACLTSVAPQTVIEACERLLLQPQDTGAGAL